MAKKNKQNKQNEKNLRSTQGGQGRQESPIGGNTRAPMNPNIPGSGGGTATPQFGNR